MTRDTALTRHGPLARHRRGRRRSRLVDLGAVTLAFVAGAALLGLYTTYRIWDVGRRDERRPADAIVVLGAAQYNGTPSAVLAARLDHAVDLYRSGLAPYFFVTGGKLPGDLTTEAQTERAYAIAHGVPASAILVEDTGRTTLESMQHVRSVFEQRGLRSAIFVSDRAHMLRLLTMASDQGITAFGSPTATSPSDNDPSLRLESLQHELGALALYLLVEQGESRSRVPLTGIASAQQPGAASAGPASASRTSVPEPSPGEPTASSGGATGGRLGGAAEEPDAGSRTAATAGDAEQPARAIGSTASAAAAGGDVPGTLPATAGVAGASATTSGSDAGAGSSAAASGVKAASGADAPPGGDGGNSASEQPGSTASQGGSGSPTASPSADGTAATASPSPAPTDTTSPEPTPGD